MKKILHAYSCRSDAISAFKKHSGRQNYQRLEVEKVDSVHFFRSCGSISDVQSLRGYEFDEVRVSGKVPSHLHSILRTLERTPPATTA